MIEPAVRTVRRSQSPRNEVHMPTHNANGVELFYELHGDAGEPLVLVHGYTGDATDWRFQVAEFAPTHRVLVIEHRGHGRSEAPADRARYTILDMVADVEALAAHAGFDRYHLVGHSMGGVVAQEIALRSPGRLRSLVLHDTGHTFADTGDAAAQARTYIELAHKIAQEQGMPALAKIMSNLPSPPHQPPERKQETEDRMSRMSLDAYIGAWGALMSWEGSTERLPGIDLPTTVICGELDEMLLDAARFLAATIPGAVLEMIPEAAHSPQYERPDLFNAALRRHLARAT
jgi:2-succinyl-6-hydroxy-2,4-cyclohexadiene-1-carboxylate synthase